MSSPSAECRSCGSPIAPDEPILTKFQRCYYCGRHHPLGSKWTLTTAPVIIVAVIGLIAVWWTHLPS
ncbi:hypothetical protein [Pseudorhodoplanes sp.]|jgi:hypothetical protein|uniref:hypothetical protein n=1 Tax=Pseudorhodoplanes sp. TaxID=1934341 RepID=UPI002B9002E3|nr:hypothetical protein [Pseudorhodoplanes sp.]HWV40756.1 hypothetical protein [Pseudorhodoplanes sp.]